MTTPTISVIIPVYNGEAYLQECLDSVLSQSFQDLQIICINDGSTDNSAAILADYAARDQRIEVITQANAGLSHSRNVGIKAAAGQYIQFLDCDDRLAPDAFSTLYKQASEQQLDILYYDGETFYDSPAVETGALKGYKSLYLCKTTINGVLDGLSMFQTLVEARSYRASACLQLLRRDYLLEKELFFYEGIYYEDNIFTLKSITQAQRTGYCHQKLYERRMHPGSIVTSHKNYKHLKSYIIVYIEMAQYTLSKGFPSCIMRGINANLRTLRSKADEVYRSLTAAEQRKAAQDDPAYELVVMLCRKPAEKALPSNVFLRIPALFFIRLRNGIRILRTQGLKALIKRLLGPQICDKLRQLQNHAGKPRLSKHLTDLAAQPFAPEAPFVSVILPVYNGCDYLKQTIASLQAQSLQNAEFIFVDDGSTDESVAVLEKAAISDKRIRVVRQENINAGAARNNGIRHAKGAYLMFLDSDDTFDPNLLLYTYDKAVASNAQVVIFDADMIRHPGMTTMEPAWLQPSRNLPRQVFAGRENQDHLFQLLNSWTKLYQREYILKEGFQYQSQFATNDAHFTMMALACAERIVTLPMRLVHYHVGRQTNIQSRKDKYPLTVYNAFSLTRKALKERGVLADVECELTGKAMESVLREMETLRTEESRQILFDTLHNGGLEDLGFSYLESSEKAQSRIGATKVQHCRDIAAMSWEKYKAVHPHS